MKSYLSCMDILILINELRILVRDIDGNNNSTCCWLLRHFRRKYFSTNYMISFFLNKKDCFFMIVFWYKYVWSASRIMNILSETECNDIHNSWRDNQHARVHELHAHAPVNTWDVLLVAYFVIWFVLFSFVSSLLIRIEQQLVWTEKWKHTQI